MAHNSLRTGGGGRASASSRGRSRDEGSRSGSSGESGSGSSSGSSSSGSDSSDDDDDESAARARRDELRAQRKRERERDLRLESKGKRSKTQRDLDRDVSERIALGMPTGKQRRETKYDTRLFNQSSGMNAGFGKDDEYNLYSKPLFDKSKGDSIYRPRTSDKNVYGTVEEHYDKIKNHGEKFRPDQDFKGVSDARSRSPRSEPVQFERSGSNSGTGEQQEDPFGLDSFLTEAKQGKKKRRGILEDRGSGRGVMSASGGSALRSAKDDDDSWRKRKMEFTRGSG
jgi:SNW domain-containing protein 1